MTTTARPADAPPAGAFYVTGGTLPADAPSYVPRQADHDLLDGLTRGEFCYVLNTRQMGKSSLMVRTARALRQQGDTVAVLDLTAVGLNLTPEQWYDGLLASLASQLHLEDTLEDFWEDHAKLGPLQRLITAVREVVLPHVPGRLVLFVDEIDAVRSLPFPADEFFAAVRECYNRRAEDPEYHRLAFCLLGVATPADLIQDTRLSPFNIGRRVLLTDFTPAEAAPLATGLGPQGNALLARVLYWTGGHPYMTQRLCRALAEEGVTSAKDADAICERLFLTKQARETDDNLAFVRNRLLRSEADLASLLDLYTQVRAGRRVKDDETNPLCGVLRLSGVVAVADGLLRVRNRVYDRVFDKDWVLAHMPGAELRRQRAAYRRGLLRATALASIVLLLMGLLSAEALHQGAQARAAARRADTNAQAAQSEKRQAEASARRAQVLAASLRVALAAARHETERATAADHRAVRQTRLAVASAATAQQQTRRAQASAREAVAEKGLATAAARRAQEQARIAHGKTQEAQEQAGVAQNTRRLADLQLAGETYDSDTGAPAVVQSLLDASRPASGSVPRRFEWRYQWSQLHDGPQMRVPGTRAAAVTPGGDLVALDATYRLRRSPVAGGHASIAALPELSTVAVDVLSPDGTRVAVGRRDGHVEVLDAATMRPVASWKAGDAPPPALTFVGAAPGVVQGVWADGSAARWDPATGKELAHWTAQQGGIVGGAGAGLISPDGRFRAVMSTANGQIILKDMARAAESGYQPSVVQAASTIRSFAFSTDGRTLAVGDSFGEVFLWDTATAALRRRWYASTGYILSLAFSPDGSRLATGGLDGLVRVWAVAPDAPRASGVSEEAPTRVASYKAHVDPVILLGFTPDGRWLATADSGGTIRAWQQDAPDQQAVPSLSSGQIDALVFPPGGRWLAGINVGDGAAFAWDAASGRPLPLPAYLRPKGGPRSKEYIHAVAFSPDGRTAAVSGLDYVWTSPDERAKGEGAANRASVFLQFWDRSTGKARPRWEQRLDPKKTTVSQDLTGLAFSPDGRTLAGGFGFHDWFDSGEDGRVRVWDAATGRTVRVLTGFGNATCALAFSPDGKTLAVGCHDGTVTCFDAPTWAWTRRLQEGAAVVCLAYSPDGRWLATGDFSGAVTVSDTRTWGTRSKVGFPAPLMALCFSPDGRTLASCGISTSVDLWDVASLRVMRSVPVRTDAFAVAFSPDGTTLAVGAGGGALFRRAGTPARVAAWEREEAEGQAAQAGSASDKPLVWTTTAQESARAQAFLHAVEARRVPAYPGDAWQADFLRPPTGRPPLSLWTHKDLAGAATQSFGPDGILTARVRRVDSTAWHVQLTGRSLPLRGGRAYVLQFRARAATPQTVSVAVQPDAPPYTAVTLRQPLSLTPQWQPFRIPFQVGPEMPVGALGSLAFSIGQQANTLQIADLVLVPATPPSPAEVAQARAAASRLLADVAARRLPGWPRPAGDANLLGAGPGRSPLDLTMDKEVGQAATQSVAPDGTLIIHVRQVDGTDNHIQLTRDGLPLRGGQEYFLQFRARAAWPQPVHVAVQPDATRPGQSSLDRLVPLSYGWRAFRYRFRVDPGGPAGGNGELLLDVGQQANDLQIAGLVLVPVRPPVGGPDPRRAPNFP